MKKLFAFITAGLLIFSLSACNSGEKPASDTKTETEQGEEAKPEDAESSESTEGEASEGETSEGETSEGESSDEPAETTADGSTIADIKARGTLRLLTNATFPPYEYAASTGVDGVEGVDVEVGRAIAEKLGVELAVVDMNFDLLPDAVNSNKGDFIAAGFTVTEERKAVVDFSIPYVQNQLLVILPADSQITSIEELADKTIAVQESTTGDYLATDEVVNDDSQILRFKSAVEAGATVANGRADACILDKLPAETSVESSGGKTKIMESYSVNEDTALAVKKGNQELLDVINEVLEELLTEDKVQEFIEHHMAAAQE